MDKEAIMKKQAELVDLEIQIDQKKKHLNWFDYQRRGGRFEGKEPKELAEERAEIVEEIHDLEMKLSVAQRSD